MRRVVRKDPEFVFDAGTIARTPSGNHPGEKGRIAKSRPKNLVYPFVGMQDKAVHLLSAALDCRRFVQERKTTRVRIALLTFERGGINGGDINPGRRSGFHPVGPESHLHQLFRQPIRRPLSNPPSFERSPTDEHPSVQEGSGGQNNGARMKNCSGSRTNS